MPLLPNASAGSCGVGAAGLAMRRQIFVTNVESIKKGGTPFNVLGV